MRGVLFTKSKISLSALIMVLLSPMFLSTHVLATPDVTQPYTYTAATDGGPRYLDPARAYDANSLAIIMNVYETLIDYRGESTSEFVPELADSWAISPDGLTYTFHIRTGVTFHDGSPLNPVDVEYSFERAMVRDVSGGPIWMLYEALIGVLGSRYYPEIYLPSPPNPPKTVNLTTAALLGHKIDDAITRDDIARTVALHLLRPSGTFMQVLAKSWSSILSNAWMIRTVIFPHGANDSFDWSGDWGDYQSWWVFNDFARESGATYYASKTSPLDSPPQMLGTGPFRFVEWVKGWGGHRTLQRYAEYWGGWPAGATGTPRAGMYPTTSRGYINTYIEIQMPDWWTRIKGLLNGTFDSVYVPRSLIGNVWQHPGIRCRYPMEALSTSAIFFNFNIADGMSGVSPYVGTETWGTGLPLNAFSNLNLRKAFAYTYNQTRELADWNYYEAFLPATPIIPGLAPFTREELIAYHVANRLNNNLTKAQYYFRLAYGGIDSRSGIPDVPVLPEDPSKIAVNGTVWNQGFTFDLVSNAGSTAGSWYVEWFAMDLRFINPRFHVGHDYVTWPDFLDLIFNEATNGRAIIPIWSIGWQTDYADADNVATPFIHSNGELAYPQSYHNPTADTLIEEARATTDQEVRKAKYTQVNDIYTQDLPQIMRVSTLNRQWQRAGLQGWYYNPAFPGTNLYTIWKEDQPVEDIDSNGKVEIKDLSIAVKAYGSYYIQPNLPPHPSGPGGLYLSTWDSRTDLNQDMRVDIKDLAMIAKKFGYTQSPWTPPP